MVTFNKYMKLIMQVVLMTMLVSCTTTIDDDRETLLPTPTFQSLNPTDEFSPLPAPTSEALTTELPVYTHAHSPKLQETVGDTILYMAPDGNDSKGDGSPEKPFKTLRRAQKDIKPGTTVYLMGGVYDSSDTYMNAIECSGTADNWIIFKNAPGERVVIDGGGFDNKGQYIGIVTFTEKAEYVCFEGIEVANNFREWGLGIYLTDARYIIIRDCKIYDIIDQGVIGSGEYHLYERNEVYNTCLNNENARNQSSGGWPFAMGTAIRPDKSPTQHVMFIDNNVHENWGEGITAWFASDVVITGNNIYDNYSVNLYFNTANEVWAENNTIYSDNSAFFRYDFPAQGIMIASEGHPNNKDLTPRRSSENIMITNNKITGTRNGIRFWYDDSNTWESNTYINIEITGNEIADISESFISFDAVKSKTAPQPFGCVFRNNALIGRSERSIDITSAQIEIAWEIADNVFLGSP